MKLFIIVDAWLDRNRAVAQIVHATASFCLTRPEEAAQWNNSTVIIKKAKNLDDYVKDADATFKEPHWEDKITAVAAYRDDEYAKELPLF